MVGDPVLTSPQSSEPISLLMVKQQLRVDAGDTSQDSYLALLISSAREVAETQTSRCYIQRGYREYYPCFPGNHLPLSLLENYAGALGLGEHRRHRFHYHHFELSRSPLFKLTQIQYIDLTGAVQTLDPGQYVLNNRRDPAQVSRMPALVGGLPWPITLCEPNAVWIDYTVGAVPIIVSIAQSATVLTGVTGYTFTSADVGSVISIHGAGCPGGALLTTVQSVALGVATLSAPALAGVVGASAMLGPQIPFGDIQAMQLLVSHWYENRTPVGQGQMVEAPYMIQNMLNKNRVYYQP
jgi:hypothetical protein